MEETVYFCQPMDFTANDISYEETGYFSKLILDYLHEAPSIRSFYKYPVSIEGIRLAAAARMKFKTDRIKLVNDFATR
ncbi:MAG TPA: hypothetical protein VKR32_13290, partial [Puia sp.]|nr:hypothetical protein [Puia sp.]